MVPAGRPVLETLDSLGAVLTSGDIVIDGGNSNYRESIASGVRLAEKGIGFLDVGVSGGIWGLEEGYCMMVGGDGATVERLRPVFESLAPGRGTGWGHVGPSGAGHFVKMVHNGIEYGMMEAMAEGFALMHRKKDLELDLHQVAGIWRSGSVIRSWLLDLVERALADKQDLSDVAPYVPDSGEGRWTTIEALDLDVAAPVITLSLLQRLRSRDEESFGDRLLSVMRDQFGGHGFKRMG